MALTEEEHALLTGWLKGHQGAYEFIDTLFDVAHTCDDLTDGDTLVDIQQVQHSFWQALIELPRCAFYTAHFALLNGALQLAFLNWQIANRLEVTEALHGKEIAYVLRSSYMDLVTLCAWIIGGTEWAIHVGTECRLYAGREGMATYLTNLTKEQRHTTLSGG